MIAENKVVLEYLPRHMHPELNPDEQVWNHAKARLSKLFGSTAKKRMQDSLQNIMNESFSETQS